MEKEPTISQNFNYRGGWKTLSLTENEIEILKELPISVKSHSL